MRYGAVDEKYFLLSTALASTEPPDIWGFSLYKIPACQNGKTGKFEKVKSMKTYSTTVIFIVPFPPFVPPELNTNAIAFVSIVFPFNT